VLSSWRESSPHFLTGRGIAGSAVDGVARVVPTRSDYTRLTKGDIAILKYADVEILIAVRSISGIVSRFGGVTCHLAIIARELDIPYLVLTENADSGIDGRRVRLDPSCGRLWLLDQPFLG
jgi:pyruvate,water dikinase